MKTSAAISKQEMLDCHTRIQPFIHCTPVMQSRYLNEVSQARLFFKCENFQRTGSFKMRGATNAVLSIPEGERRRGVVAHSSGNFAQAVALAARLQGIRAWIVMPDNAPRAKVQAVRDYGGQILFCEPSAEAREAAAARVVAEKQAHFLHPSNDLNVIMGQGTAAMEFLEQQPDLDVLVMPVGGGGLVAGCALAAYYFGKECQAIGGEPREADDAYRSLQSGRIEFNQTANTIADGLRTFLGDHNFPIIQSYVTRMIRVDEDEIVAAMRLIWERMKLICEPSCAVPLAAVLRERETFQHQRVGIVLSGGNVDLEQLPFHQTAV
jgi:threonine dehydratase